MSDNGQAADAEQTVVLSLNGADHLQQESWAYNGHLADQDGNFADDPGAVLTGAGFIWAAVRRGARLVTVLALVGLLAGFGVLKLKPQLYQASTSLLLANIPNTTPGTAIQTDQAIVQSRTVAGQVLRELGLHESVASFLADYTAVVGTSQVLQITVKAPTGQDAVKEANALGAALLAFQTRMLNTQAQLVNSQLQSEIAVAEQHVSALSQQVTNVAAEPSSSAQQLQLSDLRAARDQAQTDLAQLRLTASSQLASTEAGDATAIKNSQVLDPGALLPQSRKKHIVLYVGGGLVAGMAVGAAIVIVRALVSDRLRRRDDVARILGAPVRLSVGKVRASGGLSARNGPVAADPNIRLIVAHLRSTLRAASAGPASLAVVPVDDTRVPASCLVSLAASCAEQGIRVVVADLCQGAPAARLLGATADGVQKVSTEGADIAVFVPTDDDPHPAGPLLSSSRGADGVDPRTADPLTAVCRSADLLLTLVTLEPSLGSEHLPGWTTSVVVMVTAGESSAARVNATGEMIRLAGTPLVSAVVIGADKSDESLGVLAEPRAGDYAKLPPLSQRQQSAVHVFAAESATRTGLPDSS